MIADKLRVAGVTAGDAGREREVVGLRKVIQLARGEFESEGAFLATASCSRGGEVT